VGTADLQWTEVVYDAVGNVLETKSRASVPYDVRHTWDDLNRQVRTEDATGRVTTRAHDEAGNLVCVRQMKGGVPFPHGGAAGLTVAGLQDLVCGTAPFPTRFTFNEVGRQTSLTDATGGTWRFVYDEAGNLVAKVDANGHLTTYVYDERNQRTSELQHLEAAPQPVPSRDETSPVYQYRPPNAGFTAGTLRTQWLADGNGALARLTDARGQVTTRVTGPLNRLESVTYSGPVARVAPSIESESYTYTGTGQLETVSELKRTTAGGLVTEVTTHGYDALERRHTTLRWTRRGSPPSTRTTPRTG
jgi:YD repeat-containing protein